MITHINTTPLIQELNTQALTYLTLGNQQISHDKPLSGPQTATLILEHIPEIDVNNFCHSPLKSLIIEQCELLNLDDAPQFELEFFHYMGKPIDFTKFSGPTVRRLSLPGNDNLDLSSLDVPNINYLNTIDSTIINLGNFAQYSPNMWQCFELDKANHLGCVVHYLHLLNMRLTNMLNYDGKPSRRFLCEGPLALEALAVPAIDNQNYYLL